LIALGSLPSQVRNEVVSLMNAIISGGTGSGKTTLMERTISTPATHHAHHAATTDDGVGYYKGNFGNMFFLWDVIFGTAHISRR
jgi:Tfp pilus assembly pilus retraction ATPase PilT